MHLYFLIPRKRVHIICLLSLIISIFLAACSEQMPSATVPTTANYSNVPLPSSPTTALALATPALTAPGPTAPPNLVVPTQVGVNDNIVQPYYEKPAKISHVPHSVNSIAVQNDARLIATGGLNSLSGKNNIILWNVNTGEPIVNLDGHTDKIKTLDISSDGTTLVSAGQDTTIRIWQINGTASKLAKVLSGHTKNVTQVKISPSGVLLASLSEDNTVRLWNITQGQLLATFPIIYTENSSVVFSPDSKVLAISNNCYGSNCYQPEIVELWEVSSTNPQRSGSLTDKGRASDLYQVQFGADGKTIQLVYNSGKVQVWNVADQQLISTHKLKLIEPKDFIAGVSPDLKKVFTSSAENDYKLSIREITSDKTISELEAYHYAKSLNLYQGIVKAFASQNGQTLVVVYASGAIDVWDTTTKVRVKSFLFVPDVVRYSYFAPKDELLTTVQYSSMELREMATRKFLATHPITPEARIVVDRKGEKFVEFTPGELKLRELRSGKLVSALKDTRLDPAKAFDLSLDGSKFKILSYYPDRKLKIEVWEVGGAKNQPEVLALSIGGDVLDSAFSPAGLSVIEIISTDEGGSLLNVWDSVSGTKLYSQKIAVEVSGIKTLSYSSKSVAYPFTMGDSNEQKIDVWEVVGSKLNLKSSISPGENSSIQKLALDNSGQIMGYVVNCTGIKLWDVTTKTKVSTTLLSSPFDNIVIKSVLEDIDKLNLSQAPCIKELKFSYPFTAKKEVERVGE